MIFGGIETLWTDPHTYNFFSTSLPEMVWQLPIALFAMRHLNCHVTRCFRIGHKVEGTSHRACRKHHPGIKSRGERTTVEQIKKAHAEANK